MGDWGSKLFWQLAIVLVLMGCTRSDPAPRSDRATAERGPKTSKAAVKYPQGPARMEMVAEQIEARGVNDSRVLAAMRRVPRHEFVPADLRAMAYQDRPLPIGDDQTISQPYVVAAMTELAGIDETSRVLEVGTGSGYQAAVLAEIAADVYSIEIIESLGARAARVLEKLGYQNLHLRIGDGYRGWPEEAPFDAIVVTAAPPRIPEPLKEQLAIGGRLVIPVGDSYQELTLITRTAKGFETRAVFPVRFVPMTGEAQRVVRPAADKNAK